MPWSAVVKSRADHAATVAAWRADYPAAASGWAFPPPGPPLLRRLPPVLWSPSINPYFRERFVVAHELRAQFDGRRLLGRQLETYSPSPDFRVGLRDDVCDLALVGAH